MKITIDPDRDTVGNLVEIKELLERKIKARAGNNITALVILQELEIEQKKMTNGVSIKYLTDLLKKKGITKEQVRTAIGIAKKLMRNGEIFENKKGFLHTI